MLRAFRFLAGHVYVAPVRDSGGGRRVWRKRVSRRGNVVIGESARVGIAVVLLECMKNNSRKNKLALSTETVRSLDDRKLIAAVGGYTFVTQHQGTSCPKVHSCTLICLE